MTYNEKSESGEKGKQSWNPPNPHDRCCLATVFNPVYAPDFLANYGDPILSEYLDLANLRQAPTVQLSKELRKVQLDASLVTRLLDATNQLEILLHLEHKSKPSTAAPIQLLMEAALTIHARWDKAGRPETGFTPPVILMIIVYNSLDKWVDGISFQDAYQNMVPKFFPYVIQFKVFVINLRRFKYDHLPGELHTQAFVESLMRATDGTFNEHLPEIMQKIARSNLSESGRYDLTRTVAVYSTWTAGTSSQEIVDAISTAFKEQEGIKMTKIIQKTLLQEGIEIGEKRGEKRGKAEGKAEAKAEAILVVLRVRFKRVSVKVSEAVRQMSDPTALNSHLHFALTCTSMKEFADSLK